MQPEAINVGYRLSPQQRRLWTLQQRGAARCYCAQAALLIERELDFTTLRRALRSTIDRHEILRTTFRLIPGMDVPVQVVAESHQEVVESLDLGGLSLSTQKERVEAYLCEERERETDFGSEVLLRACLLRLAPERHVLALTLPSLCADAASMSILCKHLAGDYEAAHRGETSRLDTLQYSYFSEWQNELLEAEGEAEGRGSGLRREHESASAELKLPGEMTPSGDAPQWPQILSSEVEGHVMGRVRALAARLGAAPSSVLLACWQSLLWRLTDEPHVTVRAAFDGRKHEALRETLGPLMKYLPLRCDFVGAYSFNEIVRSVHASCLEADARQEFYRPEAASLERSTEDASLPVGFEYARWPSAERVVGQGFTLQQLYCHADDFKLKLSCEEAGEALRLAFAFDPAVYQRSSVQRIAEEFVTLLRSAVAAPESPVGRLELLPERERRRVLRDWNATGAEQSRFDSIKEAFEAQARATPKATAVVYREQQLNYAELNARANQLARHLRTLGVGPEIVVGLCMERSLSMLVGLLGALKAGGAYLPLSPTSPAERLAFMLHDAGARVLLTERHLLARLPEAEARVLCLDDASEVYGAQSTEDPGVEVHRDHLAYVIYTSGTTGRPKGVMIRQSSVLNLFGLLERSIYMGQRHLTRVSLNAPLCFDASVKQIVQLLGGRTLCIIPDEIRLNPAALLSYLERQRIDVFDCTPSQLKLLLDAHHSGEPRESVAKFPRVVLAGGEPVDAQLWRRMVNDPDVSYYNLYGPTECTVDTTARRVSTEPERPTIGRPLANVWVYILDARMQPVPIGVAGEIYVGGEGLARGYLKRPDVTAETFVPDPFAGARAARLYRTGDRARYFADGNIEFLGRLDNQIKVRGHRVELEEIEAVLNQHPSVTESAVVMREDEAGGSRLSAYVVARRKGTPSLEGRACHTLPDGRPIVHLNRNETEYLYDEIFTKRAYLRHGLSLPPDACVFDVGANIGMFTLFAAEQCATARIYAFEPIRDIFECLRLNSELYGGSVKAFAHGLSDTEKRETFTYYRGYTMMSGQSVYANATDDKEVVKSFLRGQQETGVPGAERLLEKADELLAGRLREERPECRLRRLSDVMREEAVERIDLLKIDVQRAERDVLRGIDDTDWSKIKQVVMEVHDGRGQPTEGRIREISALLERRGFRVVTEQEELLRDTDRWNLYAVAGGYTEEVQAREARGVRRVHVAEKKLPPLVVGELRNYLRQRLPEYMLPSSYTVLKELPLTRRGKIDRRALFTLQEASSTQADYVAPRGEVEHLIAAVWRELLKLERVSVEDRFFDIGGNSLLVIQMCSRLREALGRELPVTEVFSHPTIKSLAQYFNGERDERARFEKIRERAAMRESSARRQQAVREGV
jgi:amino acid adenylation domain-containing protein/FkbM family methyltransferase